MSEKAFEIDFPNPPIPIPSELTLLERLNRPSFSKVKQVWAIGAGKGGVGKSMLSSSLGLALSKQGYKVSLIDLDLGGANLHTSIGLSLPKRTLSDFFSGKKLKDLAVETNFPNLEIISGAQDTLHIPELSIDQKVSLIDSFRTLESDIVLCDLGAGTHQNTLDFFITADVKVLITLPEPTSIENLYRFVKACFYRSLEIDPSLKPIHPWINSWINGSSEQFKSPTEVFQKIELEFSNLKKNYESMIESFSPKIILNQTRSQTDIDIGFSIRSICKKYFGIDVEYIGYLDYDQSVWQAIRKKKPFLEDSPHSRVSQNIQKISQYLLKKGNYV